MSNQTNDRSFSPKKTRFFFSRSFWRSFLADHFSGFFFSFSGFSLPIISAIILLNIFFRLSSNHFSDFFPHQDARSFSDDHFNKCCVSGTDSMFCYVMFPLATTTQFSHHGGFVKHSKQSRRRCLHATTNPHRLCALPSGTFKSPNCFPFRTRMDRRQDTKRLGHTTVMLARMRLCS